MQAKPDMELEEIRKLFGHWGDVTVDPRGVDYIEVDVEGIPAMWAIPKNSVQDRALLCSHGGGYVVGSMYTHRKLFGHIAKAVAYQATLLGHDVSYIEADSEFARYALADADERASLLKGWVAADLLVLDDLFLARRISEHAAELLQALVHQIEGLLHLRDEDDVVVPVPKEAADEGDGDRVVAGDDDMVGESPAAAGEPVIWTGPRARGHRRTG